MIPETKNYKLKIFESVNGMDFNVQMGMNIDKSLYNLTMENDIIIHTDVNIFVYFVSETDKMLL